MFELMQPQIFLHYILQQHLQEGDHAIDATMGNGHDTALLSQLVGKQGRVWAFDIQMEALQQTSTLLSEKSQYCNV